MYLQKLEIQGFKSFAQKTTLEFNRQLTAVVGPNGSGKSNIADAIRWVLGEQSIKLLRGKKAEDVIFAGSDLKSRLGMAEVSLYLNNSDGSAQIEFAEIVITRRVFRDGQSEYLLNQSTVRLQDIQLLLARSNFGQKTYSVIGQGMVDSILLSSPAERKEFFEEATGVKQYQIKREQAIAKLTTTYENLEQAEILLQEIEPRLRVLTRQVKRLEQREELEREIRTLQKRYFRFRYHQINNKYKQVEAKHQELDNKVLTEQDKVKSLEQNLRKLEGSELVPQTWQALQAKQANLRQRQAEYIKEQVVAEAEESVQHLKRGEGEIAFLKQRLSELVLEIREQVEQETLLNQDLAIKKASLETKLGEQTKLLVSLSENKPVGLSWVADELSSLTQEQVELQRKLKISKNMSEVAGLVEIAAQIAEKLQKIIVRLRRLDGNNAPVGSLNIEAREALIQEIATLQGEIKSLDKEHTSLLQAKERSLQAKAKIEAQLNKQGKVGEFGASKATSAKNLQTIETELREVEKQLATYQAQAESKKSEFFAVQRDLSEAKTLEHKIEQELHEVELEQAKLETKLEDLERELAQEVPLELVHEIKQAGSVENIDEGTVALELQKLKHQFDLTGGIEPEVIAEYQQTKTRFDFLTNQSADLKLAVSSLESIIRDLDETIDKKFVASFKIINDKFVKYFQVLFGGGKAQLILQRGEVETEEEGTEDEVGEKHQLTPREKFLAQEKVRAALFSGVEIQATPPGKKLSSITALSGGEKALASIGLICAIISNNPSPFVVLDEVDAALDEANSERYAAILDSLMNETQFITITHNRATMRRAAILYGVTIGEDGISRLLSVKLEEASKIAGKGKS